MGSGGHSTVPGTQREEFWRRCEAGRTRPTPHSGDMVYTLRQLGRAPSDCSQPDGCSAELPRRCAPVRVRTSRAGETTKGAQGPLLHSLARPERFELPTPWFVAMYSIQLSYGRVFSNNRAAVRPPCPGRLPGRPVSDWRRERDSNPRWAFDPYALSRGAPSTTRPSLRGSSLRSPEGPQMILAGRRPVK
jgi:hypothetical protein